jgi:hypothetical protein
MSQDPREQQPIAPLQPFPPGYNAPSPYYVLPAPAPAKPSGWVVFRRTLRLLLRRFIYGLVIVGRKLRPVAGYLIVIVALLGVIGWMAIQLWAPKPQPQADVRVAAIPPAPSVENYIKGQQTFNGDLMWSSYSSTYQAAQLQKGASKETLQANIESLRSSGVKIQQFDYIGGVTIDGGGGMYYYSIALEYQGQQIKLPLILTVDNDGKIARVISPLLPDQSK